MDGKGCSHGARVSKIRDAPGDAVEKLFRRVFDDANEKLESTRRSMDDSIKSSLSEANSKIRDMIEILQDRGDKAITRVSVFLGAIALSVVVVGVVNVQMQVGDKLINLQAQVISAEGTIKDATAELTKVRAELIPEESKLRSVDLELEHARQELASVTNELEKARKQFRAATPPK